MLRDVSIPLCGICSLQRRRRAFRAGRLRVSIPLCGICSLQLVTLSADATLAKAFQSLCAGFARCNRCGRKHDPRGGSVSIPLCGICSLQPVLNTGTPSELIKFQSLCAGFARCNRDPRARRRGGGDGFNPSVRDLLVATEIVIVDNASDHEFQSLCAGFARCNCTPIGRRNRLPRFQSLCAGFARCNLWRRAACSLSRRFNPSVRDLLVATEDRHVDSEVHHVSIPLCGICSLQRFLGAMQDDIPDVSIPLCGICSLQLLLSVATLADERFQSLCAGFARCNPEVIRRHRPQAQVSIPLCGICSLQLRCIQPSARGFIVSIPLCGICSLQPVRHSSCCAISRGFNPSVRDLLVATLLVGRVNAVGQVVSIPLCGICSLQHFTACLDFEAATGFNPSVRDLLVATGSSAATSVLFLRFQSLCAGFARCNLYAFIIAFGAQLVFQSLCAGFARCNAYWCGRLRPLPPFQSLCAGFARCNE